MLSIIASLIPLLVQLPVATPLGNSPNNPPLPNRLCILPIGNSDPQSCGYVPPGPDMGIGPWISCSGTVNNAVTCNGSDDYTDEVGDALYFAPTSAVIDSASATCAKPTTTMRTDDDGTQYECIAAGSAWVHAAYNPQGRALGGGTVTAFVQGRLDYGDPFAGTADGKTVIEVQAWIDPYANMQLCQMRLVSTVSNTPPAITCTC